MNKRIKFAIFEFVPSFLIWVITVFALDQLIKDPDIRGLAVVIVLVGVSIWEKLSMILTVLLAKNADS